MQTTFGIIAAGLLIPFAGMADTIVSTGSLVGVPLNFQSTTGANQNQGMPFWNNNSIDGANMNAGDYLTGSNPTTGATDYLGTGFGDYLSTGGPGVDAPNFTFLQSAVTVQATLLFSDSIANYSFTNYGIVGTQIGLYNAANPGQTTTLFAAGTLWNPNGPSGGWGTYNNNLTPQSPVTANTWANYGVYAYTCGFNPEGSTYCVTYYSNAALNQATDPNHQHFALFEDPQNSSTYYIAFEDGRGMNPYEGYGDYNDVIFKLQTAQNPSLNSLGINGPESPVVTPEPATLSIMGLGLVALGLLKRRASAIRG